MVATTLMAYRECLFHHTSNRATSRRPCGNVRPSCRVSAAGTAALDATAENGKCRQILAPWRRSFRMASEWDASDWKPMMDGGEQFAQQILIIDNNGPPDSLFEFRDDVASSCNIARKIVRNHSTMTKTLEKTSVPNVICDNKLDHIRQDNVSAVLDPN